MKRRFYDGLKDDVKDELIKEERDALTLDAYMARAIAIDNRQYERRQERTGKKDAVYPKANDKKKRQPQSTSHGTHSGPMDIGAAQAQWAGRKGGAKDKSGITCYNCDKKGHVKRDCHSKEWRPVPGKEAVTIGQATVGKKVRIQEVAAASYTQDDLEVDIEQALKREDELTGSDSDNSELGNEYALITSDDEGKVAPPRHIQQAAQDWGITLTQQADGEWTTHTGDGKVRPSLFFLQQRILEQRQRIEELVREKEELKQLLQARNDQYERLRTELDSIKEGVRELTSTHEDIGRHIDGIARETQAMREAQERAWTDHAPWDRPTEHAEECGDGVHYPEQEYTWAVRQARRKERPTPEWNHYWARHQFLSPRKTTSDLETAGLRGVHGRFQMMEGDHQRMDPRKTDHIYLPLFQCIAHECHYHFQDNLHHGHWPVRHQNQQDQQVPTTWVYDHGNAPSALLWNTGMARDGRMRVSPKNAWPRA